LERLRLATPEEVVAATGREDTPQVVAARAIRELWRFNREDAGRVSVLVHYPKRDRNGPLAELFPYWLEWMKGTTDEAMNDARAHQYFIGELEKSGRFSQAPVVQDESIRIHDGRHRLFAAYDASASGVPVFPIEIYWVHTWPDGVLRHLADGR
jgi:hypothetical protein